MIINILLLLIIIITIITPAEFQALHFEVRFSSTRSIKGPFKHPFKHAPFRCPFWQSSFRLRMPFEPSRLPGPGPALLYIPQREVQWKQGVVIYTMLYTSLLYDTTPIHCTPLPLHPPVMNTHLRIFLLVS